MKGKNWRSGLQRKVGMGLVVQKCFKTCVGSISNRERKKCQVQKTPTKLVETFHEKWNRVIQDAMKTALRF